MRYELWIENVAKDELERLDRHVAERVTDRIRDLASDPLGPGTKSLSGGLRGFRSLRVGDWRVCYEVDEPAKTVTVVEVGHRNRIYQRLLRRLR